MESLFEGIQVSNPSDSQHQKTRDSGQQQVPPMDSSIEHHHDQSGDEMAIQSLLRDGEDLLSAKKRMKKQIRISKRQMLEPLKVVGRLQHLT